MTKLTFKLILLQLIGLIVTSHAQSPSKEETIDWLQDKLRGYSFAMSTKFPEDPRTALANITISDISFAEGQMKVTNNWGDSKWQHSVYLSNLSPSVKVEASAPQQFTNPSVFHSVLISSAKKGKILTVTPGGPKRMDDSIELRFSDAELAARVAKALSHLIKLSGGQDEPF